MIVVIALYDQLMFRPASSPGPTSSALRERERPAGARIMAAQPSPAHPPAPARHRPHRRRAGFLLRLRLPVPRLGHERLRHLAPSQRFVDILWLALLGFLALYRPAEPSTMSRPSSPGPKCPPRGEARPLHPRPGVALLIALASAIWVPIGVMIGLRPRLAEKMQPLAQFPPPFPRTCFSPLRSC